MLKEDFRFSRYSNLFLVSKQNWLTIPFICFILQIAIYVFFFANNGHLAYKNKLKQVRKLESEIQVINQEVVNLQKKLKALKNDEIALKRFIREYLLYQGDVKIIKFLDEKAIAKSQKEEIFSIKKHQFQYLLYSSLSLLVIIFVAFHLRNTSKVNDVRDESLNYEKGSMQP